MADTETKMAALKKSYAEIMLSMAQESAARILMSERRAIGFQRSLLASKEEAVATLLRLKSIMESKIREAEMASLGQVRRIQELEHQLNKAQFTISHLRIELKRMSNEMGNMSNKQRAASYEEDIDDPTISCDDMCQVSKLTSHSSPCFLLGPESVSAGKADVCFNQPNTNNWCLHVENSTKDEEIGMENECAVNPDLASIIMRSKEPELFRNGCTQRIRAFEQNLLTTRVPSSKTDNSSSKDALLACEHGKSKITCPANSIKAGNALIGLKDYVDSKVLAQQASNCKNGEVVKFFRRSSRRKQAKAKSNRSTSSGASDQDMFDCEPSYISSSHNVAGQDKVMDHMEMQLQEACEETGKILNSLSCPVISSCSKLPKTKWIHSKISPSNENSGNLSSEEGRVPKLGSIVIDPSLSGTVNEEDILLTGGDQMLEGHALQPEDSMASIEQRAADNGYSPTCETKLEKGEAPNADSGLEDEKSSESIKVPVETGSDQVLKYTFRRKRKRGSSSSKSESMVPEQKNTSKRRAVDKQNSLPESQKPSLMTESTRDSRRMAQVARQLISLSGKRW